jgi:hypothetical protein
MAGERSELIGRIHAARNRGDVDGVVECCSANAEVVHLALVEDGRIARIDRFASEPDARSALAEGRPAAVAG